MMIIGGGGNDTSPSTSSTNYTGPFADGVSSSRSQVAQRMPMAGTLSQLGVTLTAAPGDKGDTWVFAVDVNGTPSGVTCSIIDTNSTTTCSDATHTVTFQKGDTLTLRSSPSNGPATTQLRWTALVAG